MKKKQQQQNQLGRDCLNGSTNISAGSFNERGHDPLSIQSVRDAASRCTPRCAQGDRSKLWKLNG